jgi:MFS family permease
VAHDDITEESPFEEFEDAALRRRPVWLTHNVWTLSWVSFLQDAASEMLYPLLPVLLNSILGAPAAIIGIIEGLAEGGAATMKVSSAHLNKYMPRRMMVFIGYSAAALGKIIIALAAVWPVVLVGRVTDRLGKGMRAAPRDAILFVGTKRSHRGRVIGFHRTADTLGAVVGPTIALALLAVFDNNIRPVLWIAVIPAVLSAALVWLVRDNEKRPAKKLAPVVPAETHRVPFTEKPPKVQRFGGRLPARLNRLITVLSIFALVNFPDALLLLHLNQEGWSVTSVVGAYLLFNVSYAVLSFPAGYLTDKWHPGQIYSLGLVCFAVAYGGLGLTRDTTLSLLFIVVYGGFAAVNDTVGKSWVAKLAPEKMQLVAQARLQGFAGYGVLIAGIWAGVFWMLGPGFGSIPLLVSACVAIVAAVYILIAAPRLQPE